MVINFCEPCYKELNRSMEEYIGDGTSAKSVERFKTFFMVTDYKTGEKYPGIKTDIWTCMDMLVSNFNEQHGLPG